MPPYVFSGQMHQPERKKFPVWGIVLIVFGVLLFLTLCVVGTVVTVNEIATNPRSNFGSEWYFDDFDDEWDEEFRVLLEADLERILDGIEDDPAARAAIAGSYEVTAGYFAEGRGEFYSDRFLNGGIYTFNADGTFEIPSGSTWGGPASYEGEFIISRVTIDDFDAWDKIWMKDVEERADSDWYHLVLHNANFEWEVWMEMYISWVGTDDIILYTPDHGETKIVELVD